MLVQFDRRSYQNSLVVRSIRLERKVVVLGLKLTVMFSGMLSFSIVDIK